MKSALTCALLAVGLSLPGVSAFGQEVGKSSDGIYTDALVSCRLPGAVRKLSQGTTLLMPGKVVRIPAKDCKTRGGAYRSTPPEPVKAATR